MASLEYNYKLSDYVVMTKTGVYRDNNPLTEYCGMQFDDDDIRDIMGLFLNRVSLKFTTIEELHVMITIKVPYSGPIIFPNPNLDDMDLSDQSNFVCCDICFRIKDIKGTVGYWCQPLGTYISYQKEDNSMYNTKKGFKKEDFMEKVKKFLNTFPGEPEIGTALFLLSKNKQK